MEREVTALYAPYSWNNAILLFTSIQRYYIILNALRYFIKAYCLFMDTTFQKS